MEIQVEKLKVEDLDNAVSHASRVIHDSFAYQGLTGDKYTPIIENEIQHQIDRFNRSFVNDDTVVLVAKQNENIIGSIGFTNPTNSVIKASESLGTNYSRLVELVSAYVKPDLQRMGIGEMLVKAIIEQMKIYNVSHFGLSTGYIKGRAFWTKMFGPVTVVLPKYYNEKEDCWVWIIPLESQRQRF